MIKKSCNISKPVATLTSPSQAQGTMAEAAAYLSNAWEGQTLLGPGSTVMCASVSTSVCSPKHSRSSLAPQATEGRRSTPLSATFARKDAEELAVKAASRHATLGCPGKQGETQWKMGYKGMSPGYAPLHHTDCCGHFCLCWPFSQKVNLCIALYVLTWYSGDLLREKTNVRKAIKWMLVPVLL